MYFQFLCYNRLIPQYLSCTVAHPHPMEEQMLTQAQVDFYREHGYLLVEGMFSAEEAAQFRVEAHAVIEQRRQLGFHKLHQVALHRDEARPQ